MDPAHIVPADDMPQMEIQNPTIVDHPSESNYLPLSHLRIYRVPIQGFTVEIK